VIRGDPPSDLERTTGLEPATPTLAMAWRMSHASPPVSPVPLSCAFLELLSHPSHQIAGVDSISLVISLVLPHHGRPYLRRRPADYESVSHISATCGADHKRASDQRLSSPTTRMTSGRFPVRRGADAGRIVAISHENEFDVTPCESH
jgi:hypothetical protein